MYNVEKLEQQWIRYHRKKIILPIFAVILGFAIITSAVYFMDIGGSTLDSNASAPDPKREALAQTITAEIKVKTVEKGSAGKLNTLSTSVPSLSSIQNEEHPRIGQIIFQDNSAKIRNKVKKRKKLLIQVTERGGKDIAKDIKNRFEFAKDKSDSLFLAKYYYDKADYKASERWALETNKLDNTIEESWLIFAKSLAKQGKRVESLKVLKAFWDLGGSMKAKSLMDKIRRGKSF